MTMTRWAPRIAPIWLGSYLILRIYWAATGTPDGLSAIGGDLVVFTGWAAVALCALAAATAALLLRTSSKPVIGIAWALSVLLVMSAVLLLLDIVGAIFPGVMPKQFPLGALSRAACALGGVLLAHSAHARRGPRVLRTLAHTPAWAYWAAYLAVAGCLTRIAAQAAVGFGNSPIALGAAAAFEIAFVLAGTLLPLALVHSWGRTWPRWVPFLQGRTVPRRLVLWPATGVATGIVVYFGLMLLQMIWERLHGRNPFPPSGGLDLPEAFFWVAVPAYWIWGVGLAFAAVAYARRTRPAAERE
ncbi:hypothetical protein HDA40_000787 [Hamadaea flava]|uniref:DUF3995 domain-containing protein n=1 Tax=Hamadaea flava TaxID=1742688 RepID=A0ABV8LRD6_9ACTN|nr:hypothetical protein [Hamadaea flava]MCP2322280.1 hypothetical protein [Hamadaea flava]